MPTPYKRMLPVVILITGVVVLGLAISLNIYSCFHPKQGTITIELDDENNYSVVQPLFFNYRGYVKVTLMDIKHEDEVYLKVDAEEYVLNERSDELSIVLGRGSHKLYFNSTRQAVLELWVEDFLVVPGENTMLLLVGASLTVLGVISTIYYTRRKHVPI